MSTGQFKVEAQFLADLALGGFAEGLDSQRRRQIHIETDLDQWLNAALKEGRQVVLTGNPGDGKTQHILHQQDRHPPSDGFYYLLDASEYADYEALLSEWETAYEEGMPGILAINDGPLYEMVTKHGDQFSFLEDVRTQLEHQVVYTDAEVADATFDDIVVVDLNNREVLSPRLVGAAIDKFADEARITDHDHPGRCHIQYNREKLTQDHVRRNLEDLLVALNQYDEHVTVRDLLNFLCYLITGGLGECRTSFSDGLRYYDLAFQGKGLVFDLLSRYFESKSFVHPFVDSQLWAEAEREVNPRDTEDPREEIEALYQQKKRQFLFEAEAMDIGYESRTLYTNVDHEFFNHRNARQNTEREKERILKLINGYFVPGSAERSELRLWLSHRYRSKSSLAVVSRGTLSNRELGLRWPQLHAEIRDAIDYRPDHTALEYRTPDGRYQRLRIDRSLYNTLSALDANIPYTLRDRDEEQQLLEFMESIQYHESFSATEGTVMIKDTETGSVDQVEVKDDVYRI